MNQNQFSFQSQHLDVDWISFKFQDLEEIRERKMTTYLLKLGFNSYHQSGKLVKPVKESIQVNAQNRFEVLLLE